MSTVSKTCVRCKVEKTLDQFYTRSGIHFPTAPGHYNSECKDCLRQRSKNAGHVPPEIPRTASEVFALQALKKVGISALPGKAVSAAHVDVVAWGCVNIEVKYSVLKTRGGKELFTFTSSPMQMQRGYLGEIVMLICEYPDGVQTFHLFQSDDPVFYIKGRVKSGLVFVPNQAEALKHGANRVVMTQPMMDAAQDRWELIEQVRLKKAENLLKGA